MDVRNSNAFRELMEIRGHGMPADREVIVAGKDPFFRSPFKFGETVAAALSARAVAANDLWEIRTGRRQKITLQVETAAATCLGGTAQTRVKNEEGVYEGIQASEALTHMVSITQSWRCRDGRCFLPHFNLPHLEKKVLDVLGCEGTPEAVAEAVAKWNSEDLDRAIYEAGATGGIVFIPEVWLQHQHGKHLSSIPVVTITKIGDLEPVPLPKGGDQPLSGIRVLELCRILAGPTCGISLAEHGADVLMVTAPQLPQVPNFVRDVSHGKRSCYLDYNVLEDLFEEYAVCDDGTIYGDLKTLGPVIRMSETNPGWNGTTPELGSSEPVWL